MKVIKSSSFKGVNIGPLAVAMGMFDGLHIGHQAVINETLKVAQEKNLLTGVYSFEPHPLKILKPAFAPANLISSGQKLELLSKMGLDYYLIQKFTPEFSQLVYKEFVEEYLVNKFNIAHLVVGEDFRFGCKGKGSVDTLQELAQQMGFSVTGIKTVEEDHQRISSTRIRKLISKGQVNNMPDLLGRYFSITGRVVHGNGRGRNLGFPTANIKPATNYILPPNGVYACYVLYNNEKYGGIVNLGDNPTFNGNKFSIEVHIFDFPIKDIYGDVITVNLVEQIREEMTFTSSNELIKQIKKDILYTENLLCYN